MNVISGVLELRKKKVSDVMTHIEDAFMLSIDTILDFETVSEIMKSGFSRVPGIIEYLPFVYTIISINLFFLLILQCMRVTEVILSLFYTSKI